MKKSRIALLALAVTALAAGAFAMVGTQTKVAGSDDCCNTCCETDRT